MTNSSEISQNNYNNEIEVKSEENNFEINKILSSENQEITIQDSSGVIFGNVTNYHGPVTIYQSQINENASDDNINNGNENLCKEKTSSNPAENHQKNFKNDLSRKNVFLIIFLTTLVIICLSIFLWLFLQKSYEESIPKLQETRKIFRSEWGGRQPLFKRPLKHPTKYVLISHTASQKCMTTKDCSSLIRQFQDDHFQNYGSPDVGYNFLIGGDENIYIGRGWDSVNFHMDNSIGLSFIGNFVHDRLSAGMIKAAQILLKEGVEEGKLNPDYKLIAHNQTWNTLSPGQNVYESIKFWPHYSPELVPITPD